MTQARIQRQRNPSRPGRLHRRLGIDQMFDQGARSPSRRRRGSSFSAEDIARMFEEVDAMRDAQSQRRFPELPILGTDISMLDFPSPMPSEPPSPASPFLGISPPPLVSDGSMIRIALDIRATTVPCIARCCLQQRGSVVDEDFVSDLGVTDRPVPRQRESRGVNRWCNLRVVDVEMVGGTDQNFNMPIDRLTDRRARVDLGVDALTSLGLIGNTGPRSTPGPASVNASPLLHPHWPAPSPSPEPQRSMVPQIRIDSSSLSLPPYGSTSAEDSGSNWDILSMVSSNFDSRAWSPGPSEAPSEYDMDRYE